jgi:hypothetical protein
VLLRPGPPELHVLWLAGPGALPVVLKVRWIRSAPVQHPQVPRGGHQQEDRIPRQFIGEEPLPDPSLPLVQGTC